MAELQELNNYTSLLEELKNPEIPNHLILGNGFNRAVGIATKYQDICEKMMEMSPQYAEVRSLFECKEFDIEEVILALQVLQDQISDENENEREFIKRYIENKFKLDFMKALYQIVQPQAKRIHRNIKLKNDVYLLFQNFDSYFTLNFDPLMYLLLMKFKDTKNNLSVAYGKSLPTTDLEEGNENLLYSTIRQWRASGKNTTSSEIDDKTTETIMEDANKSQLTLNFITHHRDLKEQHKWSRNSIDLAIQHVLNEENDLYSLPNNPDDGFRKYKKQGLLFDHHNTTQNVFFLHGCLHIIDESNSKKIRKVQRTGINSLFDHIEKLVHEEGGEIICVLSGTADQKESQIADNPYLSKCYTDLGKVSGNIVILGCSLVGKDSHILKQLDRDEIETIYFGTSETELPKLEETVREVLSPDRKIRFFDYTTMDFS